jgi:hypothetical protein
MQDLIYVGLTIIFLCWSKIANFSLGHSFTPVRRQPLSR